MFFRQCPRCDKKLLYKLEKTYNYAKINNSLCRSCSAKNRQEQFLITRVCKICEKTFQCYDKSNQVYCSNECRSKDIELNKQRAKNVIKTNNNKYGVNSPAQLNKIKSKIKQTNLKRYGVEYTFQVDDFKEKARISKKEKYGNENYNNIEKNKQTCLKKYGVKNVFQTINVRNKRKIRSMYDVYNKLQEHPFNNFIKPLFSLNEYNNVKKTYRFKCLKCNTIFKDNLNNGKIPRCLNCYPLKNNSIFQKEIINYIKLTYDGKIIENNKQTLKELELDIYIPDKKLAIECNGNYWHSELNGKDKNYHLNKTILCEKEGIHLIHIFEDEWLNKQEIVKNILRHKLGLSTDKIYARQCDTREINNESTNKFLNNYHIQGGSKSLIKLGLFYENELVGVMTFGKRRLALGKKNSEKDEYELLRYATSKNVVGGAGKLLAYFIKHYNPKEIISYADRRWSQGNLYEKLGFQKIGETPINYWYFKNNYINRIHRFNFRKNILNKKLENFDPNLTEWQNMQLNGYDRIWDCGNLNYKLNI